MTDAIEIWPTKCTCGQFISDVARRYRQYKLEGIPAYEAAEKVGLRRTCCLTSLNTPTLYDMKVNRVGTIRQEVLNPRLPVTVFPLRQDKLSQLGVNLIENQVITKTEIPNLEPIRGIVEPKISSGFEISTMKRGGVVVTGYQRDSEGNPIMVSVGGDYSVPVLTYIMKI